MQRNGQENRSYIDIGQIRNPNPPTKDALQIGGVSVDKAIDRGVAAARNGVVFMLDRTARTLFTIADALEPSSRRSEQ